MLRIVLSLALLAVGSTAWAGTREDCTQATDQDLKIRACSEVLRENASAAWAYTNRGDAYNAKREFDRAIVDLNKAIEINAKHAYAYINRGNSYLGKGELDRAIADYSRAIGLNPKDATVAAYNNLGIAYNAKREFDRAIVDLNKAIELDPKDASTYKNRGDAYSGKGNFERAVADYNKSIEINPKYARAYNSRGAVYKDRGDLDRAIADFSRAIELAPKYADAYDFRGSSNFQKNDFERAIADYNKAVELDPKRARPHLGLGRVHLRKGDYDRALAELSEAMRHDGKDPEIFAERGTVYEAKGQLDRAIADYQSAVDLQAKTELGRRAVAEARTRLVALERQKQRPPPPAAQQSETAASPVLGRRVALVIGNSAYQSAGRLTNPANDARAMAASFRRLGFAEVVERYDTDFAAMIAALKNFGDRSVDADWAVVYYSGHGMEMNGIAYLIPVDARLERDTHVSDETVPLSRVLEKVETARKLRLVILDACRNNPFVARMVRTAGVTRAIGRGLGAIEPEGGVLVAYAAKHGTVAEDGAGANSPFAEAMLENLEEPGLEINYLFRKVRDQVLAATNKRQEPFLYGSLPSERLFFKFAAPR